MKKQTMGGTLTRRSFLKTSAVATAALAAGEAKAGVAQEAPLKDPMVYAGERLRNVAMPMGGIGTGQVALCGDGMLRQWQIFNNVNHLAFLPGTHFLFYYRQRRIRSGVRFLHSAEFYQTPYQPVPFVTDHVIPEYSRQVLKSYRGADRITYIGEYPLAHLEYHFDDLPLRVIMESFNPMIPLDMKDSSIPIVLFKFSFTNTDEVPTTIDLWLTLQNGVGYDGKSTIEGTHNPGYGGNQNQVVRLPGLTGVNMMSTALEASHLHNGTMMVVLFDQDAGTLCQWQDLDQLVTAHVQQRSYGKRNASDTSPRGETYNGAVVKPMLLPPGQSQEVTAAIAWSFPNQVNQWGQPGRRVNDTNTKFYVGHQYNNWFPNAMSAAVYTQQNLKRLESQTRMYHHSFFDSTLPREVLSRVSSQSSIMRSPSIFTDEKGEFFGFEGCHFAQPDWWGGTTGGCCPLNCTHVWQYAQTIAALYPSLEQSMQETALLSQMMADGSIPHRTPYPLYLNHIPILQIGGPRSPALDGMLGIILRTYRAVRRGASEEWLDKLWPRLLKLIQHLFDEFDPDANGIIEGLQPNTYDRSAYGPNTFIGSLWLAALRAMEEMAKLQSDNNIARQCRQRTEKGMRAYDRVTWGEAHYIQIVDLEKHPRDNWGRGCLSDHLIGQWWAYMLDLGDILPPTFQADYSTTCSASLSRV